MIKDVNSISYKIIACALSGVMVLSSTSVAWAQTAQLPAATQNTAADQDDGGLDWPRSFSEGNLDYTVYQPQIDSWNGDRIEARAAIAIKAVGAAQAKYGVAWFSATTLIDRQDNTVQLSNVEVSKVSFPSDTAQADSYAAALRKHVRTTIPDVSLSILESSLAVSDAEKGAQAVELKNNPPHIYFSEKPAFLIRIDGKPVLRQIPGSKMLRVINTTSLLAFDDKSGTYYLRAFKRWYETKLLDSGAEPGEWRRVTKPPAGLDAVLKAAGADTASFDTPPPAIAEAVNAGKDPVFYVASAPAELVQTTGAPEILPITGTNLLYVKNTAGQVLIDGATQIYYVLISGRWFKSSALNGPDWTFVPSDQLPADFARIPESNPKGVVLASVAGTPQAKEALIDNSIPQMAQVNRAKAKFSVTIDGAAQMKPIEGTNLQYVANASAPVILVGNGRYYAVANGIWFTAASLAGPWAVASEVPAEIYGIPTSSPLHFVTYVRIYGSSPKEVTVGYTPGYYGTAVSSSGVVVYGTGYAYDPWIGGAWYPAPVTYGYGEGFAWGAATGFVFGAAVGAIWAGGAWGWRGWGWGWNNRPVVTHYNFNNNNIYNRWQGNAVESRFRNQVNNGLNNRVNNGQGRLSAEQRQNLNNRTGGNVRDQAQDRNRGDARNQAQDRNRAQDRNKAETRNQGKARDQAQNRAQTAKQGGQKRPANRAAPQNRPRASGSNNIYAGRDGNVYRRDAGGGWQQRGNSGWNPATNANVNNRLNADRAARSRGNAMGGMRSGGGGGGFHSGGPRGGGAAFRGGGGGRGGGRR